MGEGRLNFYKRHLGDYAKDAGHLSMLEHGAYTLLLDRYYTTEKPIASRAEAHRVCRARSRDERAAVDAVLAEFFVSDGEAFQNRRAEEEIAKASHQRTVNQAIGKLGGRRKQTESVSVRNPSQTPDSISQTPKEKAPPLAASDLIEIPLALAEEWIAHRKRKRAPLTAAAWQGIKDEAERAGWPIDKAIRKALARGWQSFDASFVADEKRVNGHPVSKQAALEARNREAAEEWLKRGNDAAQ
jgi:uncharacterized protein YdaU (DUF1376 family)